MNRSNLQLMADHIKTIPQEMFNMEEFRHIDKCEEIKCNSVGCVIGHCVQLDPDPENIPKTMLMILIFMIGVDNLQKLMIYKNGIGALILDGQILIIHQLEHLNE